MAVTVQMQFESVVTELYQDAFVGSSIENGTTIIQFDLRKLDFRCALGTTAPMCWRQECHLPHKIATGATLCVTRAKWRLYASYSC